MKVQEMKLSEIKPYEGNPRNNERAIDKVAESIRQFGPRQPIVVDKAGVIIVGHTRYFAALKIGLATFPVHVARDLSEANASLYRIADNRTAEYAEWDVEKLRTELAGLVGKVNMAEIEALGICESEWPALAVPDFESLGVDTDKAAGVRSNLLAIGKYRIVMTDAEEEALMTAVEQYSGESGTLFGFVRWILVRAGVEVRGEVDSAEGQVATLV